MAKRVNWIEKLGLEKLAQDTAGKLYFNRMSDENPSIILKALKKVAEGPTRESHAPVIDAEKLAEKFIKKVENFLGLNSIDKRDCNYDPSLKSLSYYFQGVITDSIDLDITWVEAETVRTETVASYGRFYLYACDSGVDGWTAYLCFDSHRIMEAPNLKSLELAQQACEKALKGIITGVKE